MQWVSSHQSKGGNDHIIIVKTENKCPDGYQLVWQTRYRHLAKTFHVSNNLIFTTAHVVTAFIFSLYRENWGTEKLSSLPMATQQENTEFRLQSRSD